LGALAATVVVSLFAAYSFARLRWKYRDTIFLLFLTSMFIPWEINAVPLYFVTKYLGILGTRPGVFLPIAAMPIGMFLLRQFFISIPQDIEDAAYIDGCGTMDILFRIFLPMTLPVIGALIIWVFLFAWNEFFWSMISLQRSSMVTLPIGLKNIMGSQNIDYGGMFAASFLALLPSLSAFLFLRKQIIRGITVSGSFR
jgi:ABC-type glycerol-3-phosphate transport system permease component